MYVYIYVCVYIYIYVHLLCIYIYTYTHIICIKPEAPKVVATPVAAHPLEAAQAATAAGATSLKPMGPWIRSFVDQ